MLFSRKCAYAIRALTRIALADSGEFMLLERICEGTDLPKHYMAKILSDLKRRGLLISAKGPGGGFALARDSQDVCLKDIILAVDGVQNMADEIPGLLNTKDQSPYTDSLKWVQVRNEIQSLLTTTSLEEISNNLKSPQRESNASLDSNSNSGPTPPATL